METYDDECLEVFLKKQKQLFREEVASNDAEIEEAGEVFALSGGRYLVVEG